MSEHDQQRGADAGSEAATSTAQGHDPGKRTLTGRLQLRRASAPGADSATPPSSAHDLSADLDATVGIFPATDQVQRVATGEASDGSSVHEAAGRGVSGAGGALPHADAIQRSFGRHDISHVQAHTDDRAASAASAIGAEAYATGNHVAFAGAPSLHTAAHEAAHVVQQLGGVSLAGGVGREGDAHEQHADQVADAVVAGRSAEGLLDAYAGGGGATSAVQRMKVRGKQTASTVSGTTHDKHVVASGAQAQAAQDGYGSRTFVTSDALLTSAVDADGYDFPDKQGTKSDRHDFNASVVISQYSKTEAPPDGFAKGKPVAKTIDATATNCEIGVVKTGVDALSITHFKKV